jgi:tetratricopeptide (TPR) repeat protein
VCTVAAVAAVAAGTRPALAVDLYSALVPVKEAFADEKWDAAVAAGEYAVKTLPGSSETHLWLGRAYGQKAIHASIFSRLGFAKKCLTEFEKAVALDPNSTDARYDLLSFHVNAPGFAGGDMAKAREQAAEIARLDPARGHVAEGAIFTSQKMWPEAEAEYVKALDLAPDSAYVHWRFGRFLVKRGRQDEARVELHRALALDPANEGARNDLAHLGG